MKYNKLLFLILALSILISGTSMAQSDPVGAIDTLTLVVNKIEDGKWMISVQLWNDEELAALDIPLGYTAGIAKLVVDSVSYAGTRIDYFAQKYMQADSIGQVMHFGGIAYMGPDKPPLEPGQGEIGKVYISVIGSKKPGPFAVDTAFYAPNNHLMLVDTEAKTIIPALKIETKK
ncbi:MAG: hypothetical protein V3V99_09385 [candidate division Zixibacteria bacterium]